MTKAKTHIHFILDNSGSMSVVQDATISGFNEYIGTLKSDGNTYKMTLTKFGIDSEVVYADKDLGDVPLLNRDTYEANGHSTALYDAVCRTLKDAEGKGKTAKHLVIIMTDGQENSSHEYTEKQMTGIKHRLEDTGRWSFVFLGANQDAWATAQAYGFAPQNVATFNQTVKGTHHVFQAMSASTGAFARGASMNSASYFSKDQQDSIKETK